MLTNEDIRLIGSDDLIQIIHTTDDKNVYTEEILYKLIEIFDNSENNDDKDDDDGNNKIQ